MSNEIGRCPKCGSENVWRYEADGCPDPFHVDPQATASSDGLRALRAKLEYRLTVALRHVPGATEAEIRHYNDGQAFGLRTAIEYIDAALADRGNVR